MKLNLCIRDITYEDVRHVQWMPAGPHGDARLTIETGTGYTAYIEQFNPAEEGFWLDVETENG